MTTVCLVGSTGLVGTHLLATLAASSSITSIQAFSRRAELALPSPSPSPSASTSTSSSPSPPRLHVIHSPDSTGWPALYPSSTPSTSSSAAAPDLFISALGTTARIAGSFAAQRLIDYDLNLALARAAASQGTRVYVLISTNGADAASRVPYLRMKGELDDAVAMPAIPGSESGFERVVVLRPGLLVGERQDSRPGEFVGRKMAGWLGSLSGGKLKDGWAVDAEVVARAAVRAGLAACRGEQKERVRVIGHREVLSLGAGDGEGVVG